MSILWEMGKPSLPENRSQIQKRFNAYVKHSSLAIQMMVIIAGGTYGGFRLDKFLGWKFPVFTVVLSLLSVVAAIWFAIKDLLKK
jgi:hypothetical protein